MWDYFPSLPALLRLPEDYPLPPNFDHYMSKTCGWLCLWLLLIISVTLVIQKTCRCLSARRPLSPATGH